MNMYVNNTIHALGDFNNDKFTDLFVVGCDQTCISVILWDTHSWSFHELSSASLQLSQPILNIAPSDFNHDGVLDLLVTTTSNRTDTVLLHLFFGQNSQNFVNGTFLLEEQGVTVNMDTLEVKDQVLLMDSNGDMRTDFFAPDVDGNRCYFVNKDTVPIRVSKLGDSEQVALLVEKTFQEIATNDTMRKIDLNPLFFPTQMNSFVDINGDCVSDLIIISVNETLGRPVLEIWINQGGSFQLHKTFVEELPYGFGRLHFADVNRDGTMDIIFSVCFPYDSCFIRNDIVVWYNIQKYPICSDSSNLLQQNCRSVNDLCTDKLKYDYEFVIKSALSLPANQHIQQMRLGDYNLDGYSDLLLVVNGGVELHHNIAFSNGTIVVDEKYAVELRTFEREKSGVEVLDQFFTANIQNAFFFDLDESGIIDIIIMDEKNRTISVIYNNLFNDAFFLKFLGLNGAVSNIKDNVGIGSNAVGISIKFTTSDSYGYKSERVESYQYQSSYFALQTPYSLLGLGRTNGYIEEFEVGISSGLTKMFNGLIPNSQLVLIPYPYDNPNSWSLQLLLSPVESIFWVLLAIVVALIAVAIPILLLYIGERRRDSVDRNKRRMHEVFIG